MPEGLSRREVIGAPYTPTPEDQERFDMIRKIGVLEELEKEKNGKPINFDPKWKVGRENAQRLKATKEEVDAWLTCRFKEYELDTSKAPETVAAWIDTAVRKREGAYDEGEPYDADRERRWLENDANRIPADVYGKRFTTYLATMEASILTSRWLAQRNDVLRMRPKQGVDDATRERLRKAQEAAMQQKLTVAETLTHFAEGREAQAAKAQAAQDAERSFTPSGPYVRQWEAAKKDERLVLQPEGLRDGKEDRRYLQYLIDFLKRIESAFSERTKDRGEEGRTVVQYVNFIERDLVVALGEFAEIKEGERDEQERRDRIRLRIRNAYKNFSDRLEEIGALLSPDDREALRSFLKTVVWETVHDDLDREPHYTIDPALVELESSQENKEVRAQVRQKLPLVRQGNKVADEIEAIIHRYCDGVWGKLKELIPDGRNQGEIDARRESVRDRVERSVRQEIAQYSKLYGWKHVRRERTRRRSRAAGSATEDAA